MFGLKKAHDYFGRIESDGYRRSYIVHLPKSYTTTKKWPLVLILHGGWGAGRKMVRYTNFNKIADEEGFIVVYPDGVRGHWADGRRATIADKRRVDDVRFISSLIDKLLLTLKINSEQVYAAGISNGGFMTFRLGCELADKIAAIGVVAATLPEIVAEDYKPSRPVPLIMFHGTDDRLVPKEGGVARGSGGDILSVDDTLQHWAAINGCWKKPTIKKLPVKIRDGTSVIKENYTACKDDADVVFYKIVDGGHNWPGAKISYMLLGKTTKNINASELIWDFFKKHPKT